MKIAVAAMGHTVAGHFGHCENFIFFDVEDNKIVEMCIRDRKEAVADKLTGTIVKEIYVPKKIINIVQK